MKITIIGSGNIMTSNHSASYLIDKDILVDIPNGTCKMLYRLGILPTEINHVLITHFHGDHYFDLPFYLLTKSKSEKQEEIHLYCSPDGKEKNEMLLQLAFPTSTERINKTISLEYHTKDKFQLEKYQVEKVLVDHGKLKPAFGYLFHTGTKTIGFTGDSALCPNIEWMASCCDYLFCDCSVIEGTSNHMGINNIEYLKEKNPNCQFIVGHLADNTREELKRRKDANLIIPEDGQVIEI